MEKHLDKKGGDPEGLLLCELAKLSTWKLKLVELLLKIHLSFIVRFYLRH